MLKTTRNLPRSSPVSLASEWGWVHTFIVLQLIFQLLLLVPQIGALRLLMRTASFGLSLFLSVWLRGDGPKHPATKPAIAIMFILVISLFVNPSTNTFLAGAGQCALYAAIMGPLLWVKGLKITPNGFKLLIFLMWGFHTISSIFGVLQVYFPGQFQPVLSTAYTKGGSEATDYLITLANGAQVYRPMGLTDTPGGAGVAGFYALLLSVGIALNQRHPILRVACISSASIGLFCLYLSQVRAMLVIAAICLLALAAVLARQGEFGKLTAMLTGVGVLITATFSWALAIGGQSSLNRLSALVDDRADTVYYNNRGHFLEDTFNNLLSQYPLGAGLGRWGMMYSYFGDPDNPASPPLWAEIQWSGWLFDGGVPLMIAYVVALYFACYTAWQIAMNRQSSNLTLWGGLIFAYNIGAVAFTFSYSLFISQAGMEFWLLNTSLLVAAYQEWIQRRKLARRVE